MCHDPHHPTRCLIPAHPDLRKKVQQELERLNAETDFGPVLKAAQPKRPGMNDGLILPGNYFPLDTPVERVRNEAAERAPLRGALRVIVVLVDFPDKKMSTKHNRAHFQDLFFSRAKLPTGSVAEYFSEVSHGLVDIVGEVVGPYTLPKKITEYANNASGTGNAQPNARTMARHAAELANAQVDFKPYDNDGKGFVDAFIVVHAGAGAEQTGSRNDIWSHKWVLPNGEYNADGTKIYAYLTVPEDSKIGVCCHELGHLLFGWPDLYDVDGTSEGLGNWCLMAGGSWNGSGDVPAHPSAWCKSQQSWVKVVNQTQNELLTIADVKDQQTIYRLWKDGAQGREYFLVENRQRRAYDRLLPGDGLLVYHIDDAIESNADERHPKVALVQADGRGDLNNGANRGDAGDAYPGTSANRTLNAISTPNSRSYAGVSTDVALTEISASSPRMTVRVAVRPAVVVKPRPKPRWNLWDWLGFAPGQMAGLPQRRSLPPEVLQDLLAQYGVLEPRAGSRFEPGDVDAAWQRAVEERMEAIEAQLVLLRHELGQGAAPDGGSYTPQEGLNR